ncbi:MAG: hypothetical protein FJZ80_04655 [Bacteroidetes bacterium]|nr:hypothetical protein [Bacteroidota bacterium]MBM3424151.1 hypothetical protein [Bacteroidota bacterium]
MIERIASLGAPALWTIFILCAFLMAIFPFLYRIKKAWRIKFSNQQAGIHDFSWRLAPDHLLFSIKDSEYYLQSGGKQFILEGGAIILSWHVTGAYQIDLEPVGADLKGNAAVVTAKKAHNRFVLIAHTLEGKLTQELFLEPTLFRTIDTFNLSQELHFKQKKFHRKTRVLSKSSWMQGKYQRGKMQALPQVTTERLNSNLARYYFSKLRRRLRFLPPNGEAKSKINRYISNNKIVNTLRSSNANYNNALNNQEPL